MNNKFFNKKSIGLDLISNPKKIKPIFENKKPQLENDDFSIAKKNLLYKINNFSIENLNLKPIDEVDMTIHCLFHFLLYKPHINNTYNRIKDKKD
tara:strand:- start:13468 stop:13752 length:285 start_codon:yes stop_codon:yes gene_type:complete